MRPGDISTNKSGHDTVLTHGRPRDLQFVSPTSKVSSGILIVSRRQREYRVKLGA
jgi:hypothetical protein